MSTAPKNQYYRHLHRKWRVKITHSQAIFTQALAADDSQPSSPESRAVRAFAYCRRVCRGCTRQDTKWTYGKDQPTWSPVCRRRARPSATPHVECNNVRSSSAWTMSAETAEPYRTGGCFVRSSWSAPGQRRLVYGSLAMMRRTLDVVWSYQIMSTPSCQYTWNTMQTSSTNST